MSDNNSINLTTIIQRDDKKFLANKLGEEIVMMNMETGDFASMNKVGADIWELAENSIAVADLVQKLQDIYDISAEQCTAETLKFLRAIAVQGMFIFHNPGVA